MSGQNRHGAMTAAEGRKFGLVVGGAFLVLASILYWRHRELFSTIAASLGGLLVAGGLLVPTRLGPIERGWMKLALMISKVTTPIFMAIIFFLVITPAGLLARLFGHRALGTAPGGSAWSTRAPENRKSDLQRQF